jgi:vibriolysin
VHLNSGIANLAFKLMTTGGQHPRGRSTVVVGGLGIDAAARIW